MKAVHKLVTGLAVAGLAVTAAIASRPMPHKLSQKADWRGDDLRHRCRWYRLHHGL